MGELAIVRKEQQSFREESPLKTLLRVHRYLSCFVAPVMLFFAISGAWQAFRLQETRKDGSYRIIGAAWGAPIARVEVRIDSGPWLPATIDGSEAADFAWKIWSLDWPSPASGEHTITSRAIDTAGDVQPAMDAPSIVNKHTYWESNGQVSRKIRIA
jgi:hypothetical protein